MPLHLPKPAPGKLNPHFILGEIIDHIGDLVEEFPNVDILQLRDQLNDIRNHKVDPELHVRGFLKAFKRTPEFKDAFDQLDEEMQSQLEDFMGGKSVDKVIGSNLFHPRPSPAAKHHFRLLDLFKIFKSKDEVNLHLSKTGKSTELPIIYEDADDTKIMEVYSDKPFDNWGLTVKNTPKWTFVPTTILGLQNLVKYAKTSKLRVRCSGYRHSWSPTFSGDREILVSLLNLQQVTHLPDPSSLEPTPAANKTNELKVIELASESIKGSSDKRLCRVGVAVTNEEFRRWAIANKAWCLPMDVILVEVTCGGVNGPICHGAGRRHKTISDQVRMIEYVDANGEHRQVSDPALLKAAAGCFGLLGVVTHITFELHGMTYAVMEPRKSDITLAIPPLKSEDVPFALQKTWTEKQLGDALADFEKRARDDYYSEWFWFTYQSTAWINTWNTTADPKGVEDYPSPPMVFIQWLEDWIAGIITGTALFNAVPGYWQAQFLATTGMLVLPPTLFEKPNPTIKTYIPDALHFRRGIQNMRVRDIEFQIPLTPSAGDPEKPDFTNVRRAWWDVLNLVYRDSDSPMRLTLELRIMNGSDMIMAPQRGNDLGTASIEVLTVPNAVTDDEWQPFIQEVADKWMSYTDAKGAKLNVRPHWAKEWVTLKMGGKPAKEYLKSVAYKDAIPEFKATLSDIGKAQGWTLADIQARFSNELWDEMIYS